MPKRIKQRWPSDADVNEVAFQFVQRTGEQAAPPTQSEISRVMAELGRRGGKKGGKRRLETMTPEKRRQVARNAAQTRWRKRKG